MAAATPTSSTATLSMTLLVDSRSQRVLYAQAGKDVVDFLISLLASLVDRGECPSSIGNLYGSVKKLADAAAFADEKVSQHAVAGGVPGVQAASSAMYMVMDDLKVAPMSATSGGNGVALLKSLGVKCVATLQEKTVPLGHAEGLEILKTSLQSKMVLTDVYLRKNKSPKLRVCKSFFCIPVVLVLMGALGALIDELSRPAQPFRGGCRWAGRSRLPCMSIVLEGRPGDERKKNRRSQRK